MHALRSIQRLLVPILGLVTVAVPGAASAAGQNAISRVSVDTDGAESKGDSGLFSTALSSDGRYVAFDSIARNLVNLDTNGRSDVFVHDRATGATVRISVDSAGVEGDGDSTRPALSSDGRFVAFQSLSDNLVAGDGNFNSDIFVHDRDPDLNGVFDEGNGVTTRASVSSSGGEGDAGSFTCSISGDGNFVAYASDSTNLVSGGDTNNATDVFLFDRATATTTRLSLSTGGAKGNAASVLPAISADGAFITFESAATNLVSGDTNGRNDVFLRDRVSKVMSRVSLDSTGVQGNGHSRGPAPLSSNGDVIAFHSGATNLVAGDTNSVTDVFLRDRLAGMTTRASLDSGGVQGNAFSSLAAISADGSVVAFQSVSSNLVAGDGNAAVDVFVHDVATGETTAASFNCGDVAGNGASTFTAISGDGLLVAFASVASDLVTADGNAVADVFVNDRSVIEPDASWNNYDVGFPGTNGVPTLTASADPKLNTTISIDVGNSAGFFTVGFLLFGPAKGSIPTNDGGTLVVDFSLIVPLAVWPGGLFLPVDIPNDPVLCGLSAFLQAVEMDDGAQYGLSFSQGLELFLGH